MKYLILIILFLSPTVFGENLLPEIFSNQISELFESSNIQTEGDKFSGSIKLNGETVGFYACVHKSESLIPILAERNRIKKLEYRNDEQPLDIKWTTKEKKDIELIHQVLTNNSHKEFSEWRIYRLNNSESIKVSSMSSSYFGCSDGLYLTLDDGEIIWIKGHEGQDFFTIYRDDHEPQDIKNIALGVFLEFFINSKKSTANKALE